MAFDDTNPFASPRSAEPADEPASWPLAASETAVIEPVPEPYRGRVFTRGHVLMNNVLGCAPALLFFGGLAMAALGVYLVDREYGGLLALPAFLAGGAGLVLGAVAAFWFQLFPEDRYSRWKFRRAVRLRPAPWVDADDPEAVFVGLTPRENWQGIRLEISTDMGLAKISPERSALLIEGDLERFRIPRRSVLFCEEECFHHPVDARTQHWLVRLVAQTPQGPREILFGLAHVELKPRTNKSRRAAAAAFCRRLLALDHEPGEEAVLLE